VIIERIREASPRRKARIAGIFYLLAVVTAVLAEAFVRGKALYAAGLVPVLCFVVVTLLFFSIFTPVNRNLTLLAVFFNLAGLTCEAFEAHFRDVNIALVFHGLYCVLIGFLVVVSWFLPRILGVLMGVAGAAWLTSVSPSLADRLSPVNTAAGFVGEGSLMLWLLSMGVNVERWNRQAGAETSR
jgi:hypothetical protein